MGYIDSNLKGIFEDVSHINKKIDCLSTTNLH